MDSDQGWKLLSSFLVFYRWTVRWWSYGESIMFPSPSLSSSFPPFLIPSLPRSLPPFLLPSLPHSLPPSFPPSLPPSLLSSSPSAFASIPLTPLTCRCAPSTLSHPLLTSLMLSSSSHHFTLVLTSYLIFTHTHPHSLIHTPSHISLFIFTLLPHTHILTFTLTLTLTSSHSPSHTHTHTSSHSHTLTAPRRWVWWLWRWTRSFQRVSSSIFALHPLDICLHKYGSLM